MGPSLRWGDGKEDARRMIDNFALALSHGLLILAAWRLVFRADLDDDCAAPGPEPRRPFRKGKTGA
jgi:hypothetical protein